MDVHVLQRAELAALRTKREQEAEMKRAQAKRDKLFVASFLLLHELLTSQSLIEDILCHFCCVVLVCGLINILY